MATSKINNPYNIGSAVEVQSNYGAVVYRKCGSIVQVFVNCNTIPTDRWVKIASGLPGPATAFLFPGLNGASGNDISLNLELNGNLMFYGRGNLDTVTTGYVYITQY